MKKCELNFLSVRSSQIFDQNTPRLYACKFYLQVKNFEVI